jgi:transcriptional repressor NrdR
MRCPYCHSENTRVVDSRESDEGETVRRRRACQDCDERYTTYERVELHLPYVVKSDGTRERFNENKLRDGFSIALQKRPINTEQVENVLQRLLRRFSFSGDEEIHSVDIGEAVMAELRDMDEVAYVRFASVYRKFQDLDEFNDLVQRLREVLPDDASEESKASLSLISGVRTKNNPK